MIAPTGASPLEAIFCSWPRPKPDRTPRAKKAKTTAASRDSTEELQASKNWYGRVPSAVLAVPRVPMSMRPGGSSTAMSARVKEAGLRGCSGSVLTDWTGPRSRSGAGPNQRLTTRVSRGPVSTAIGMPMTRPHRMVRPVFAPYAETARVGEGCGGSRPCDT